ncbi:MAG: hypothetical protein HUU20_19085 [Pirellulales bacterium]|nr:hypothetical protein [Pirellulales bacterium]
MTTGLEHVEYRRLRAPREDGAALVEPAFGEVSELAARNRSRRRTCDYDFQGRSLAELARAAREELIREAQRYTSAYRDVDLTRYHPTQPIYLAGHQPQLFHPGVWYKNFVLGSLARRHQAQAVNLVIDSDTIKSVAIRVPGGPVEHPRLTAVEFDRPGPPIPFEERPIQDRELYESFGGRVAEQIRPLVRHPLIEKYWPMAVARSHQTGNLGECLAESRHRLEGCWGTATLELPQSRVCDLPSFSYFTAHLLAHLPRLRMIYNDVVAEYRRSHHVRSTAHPVPDLAVDDDWLEAPYWIWSAEDPRRRRLFAKHLDDEILLTDRRGLELALPLSPESDAAAAVDRLSRYSACGIKIRSRALITTLWARLVLGDLFLHGIGGAKYDQVTDAICTQFFGMEPPRYLVVSATLYLPVAHRRTTDGDVRRVNDRLRQLAYHPDRVIQEDGLASGPAGDPSDLMEEKRRWIGTPQTPGNAAERFRQFHRINEALQPWVASERRRLLDRREHLERALRAEAILSSREYAFCLFPETTLREFLQKRLPA